MSVDHPLATSGVCVSLSLPRSIWAPLQIIMACYQVISCMRTNKGACVYSWFISQSNTAGPLQFINKGGAWATFPFFSMLRTQCHQKDNINLLLGDRKLWICKNCACFKIMNHWRSLRITDPCAWEEHIICHKNLGGVQVREAKKVREKNRSCKLVAHKL